MARFNFTRSRRQRHVLRDMADELIRQGVTPEYGRDGKPYLVIEGRHYVLPEHFAVHVRIPNREVK